MHGMGDGRVTRLPAPALAGRRVIFTRRPCPECQRLGWQTTAGETPAMVEFAHGLRRPWEPDAPFCLTHGYPEGTEEP